MKEMVNRGRKVLRTFFRVISVSAASLILQACYGILPPDDTYAEYGMPPEQNQETTIRGKVRNNETGEPIFGIKVSIEGTEAWDRTDKNGDFYLYVPNQAVYRIKLEDVDGPYNDGRFKDRTYTFYKNDTSWALLLGMDLTDTQTNTESE